MLREAPSFFDFRRSHLAHSQQVQARSRPNARHRRSKSASQPLYEVLVLNTEDRLKGSRLKASTKANYDTKMKALKKKHSDEVAAINMKDPAAKS